MEVTDAEVLEIIEQSQVADARRRVGRLALEAGLSEQSQNRLAVISTELATNLLKHTGKGGKILMQVLREDDLFGVELYSIDSGCGMNIDDCVIDGVSSTGTLGTGLGAIKRMSDECEIYSSPGAGTVVQIRVWSEPRRERLPYSFGGFTVPKAGEQLSGDKWMVLQKDDIIYSMLVDGLGHGLEASEAARLAKQRFRENWNKPPAAMIKALHTSLRGGRGAVGAVARLNLSSNKLDYCGLGNITGIMAKKSARKHLVSMNGTLGYEAPKIMEFSYPWTSDSLLVMYSDGFASRASDGILPVQDLPAPIIAGWLYQQYAKSIDDATVLVMRQAK